MWLIKKILREIEGAVVARVNVRARELGYFVGLHADSFEANATRCAIVKLTDIQNTAVG
jgi:hypothetical protein